MIIGRPDKRPYGARIEFQVIHAGVLGGIESASILLGSGEVASLEPARQPSWEGGRRFEIRLKGFATASVAECQGRKLAQALLWTAVSVNSGLRLRYFTKEAAAVFERQRTSGVKIVAEGETRWDPRIVLRELVAAYAATPLDPRTLLSMEIFCSSSLEASDRARFLTAVSALEPLAESRHLGSDIDTLVRLWKDSLLTVPAMGTQLRSSLEGRLEGLRRESIRQALRRIVVEVLPDVASAPRLVDAAYGLRSQMIHEGQLSDYDVDLPDQVNKVGALLRLIYSKRVGLALHARANI